MAEEIFCCNCSYPCKNQNSSTLVNKISISSDDNDGIRQLYIADAISYIYGGGMSKIPMSAELCSGCAVLLGENYKAHKMFETASHPQSVIQKAKLFKIQTVMGIVKMEETLNIEEPRPKEDVEQDAFSSFNFDKEDGTLSNTVDGVGSADPDYYVSTLDVKFDPLEIATEPEQPSPPSIRRASLRCKQAILRIKKLSNEMIETNTVIAKRKRIKGAPNKLLSLQSRRPYKRKSKNAKGSREYDESSNGNRSQDLEEDADWCMENLKSEKGLGEHDTDNELSHIISAEDSTVPQHLGNTTQPKEKSKLIMAKYKEKLKIGRTKKVGLYNCKICGKPFTNYESFKRHPKIHRADARLPCSICGKILAKTYLKRHLATHTVTEEEKQLCLLCGKRVLSLKTHMLHNHNPEKKTESYPCDQCAKVFNSHYRLKQHSEMHLKGLLKCQVCGKGFEMKGSLKQHEKTHEEEKRYQCHLCPMCFRTAPALKYHMYSHALERQFVCHLCGKSFKFPRHLRDHLKYHKEVEEKGEKAFCCEECGKAFNNSRLLYYHHLRTHRMDVKITRLMCRYCGKVLSRTSSKTDLLRHERLHTKTGENTELTQETRTTGC